MIRGEGQGHEARDVRWRGRWFDSDGNCKKNVTYEKVTRYVPVLLSFDQAAQYATGMLNREDMPPRTMPTPEHRIVERTPKSVQIFTFTDEEFQDKYGRDTGVLDI
jgi:hypothetical protein